MGCCQSEQQLDLLERGEAILPVIDETSSIGYPNDSQEQESPEVLQHDDVKHLFRKQLMFPGYEKIIKNYEKSAGKMRTSATSALVSGFIEVNIVNTPKADFFSAYHIGRFLGQGGFGTVCAATHRTTKAKRAVKMVSKASLSKQDSELLLKELALLKEIDHPNILKILEHYEDEQHHFFVTELLSGGELFSRIMEIKGFDEALASDYMRQILSAVSYCHARNIVHRDIKPENILFQSATNDQHLKVIDFGCSTKFDRSKKITEIVGTVQYIAPEVIKGDTYDEKCDIWSLGTVMYIMLCGYPPFDAPTDDEIFDAIQNAPLTFPDAEWSTVSLEAKDMIKRMLKKNPAERMSASEAYREQWIQRRISNCVPQESIMKNLALFSARNKVKTAILNLITLHVMTHKDKEDIMYSFQQLDRDGDGQLSREELIEGYQNLVGDRIQAQLLVDAVFGELDYDGSGQVSFQEFLVASVSKEKLFSTSTLRKAFDLIDEDRNGFITKEELERLVGGTPINKQAWEHMMKEVDINRDGKLDKQEFITLLTNWLERDLAYAADECEDRGGGGGGSFNQKEFGSQMSMDNGSPVAKARASAVSMHGSLTSIRTFDQQRLKIKAETTSQKDVGSECESNQSRRKAKFPSMDQQQQQLAGAPWNVSAMPKLQQNHSDTQAIKTKGVSMPSAYLANRQRRVAGLNNRNSRWLSIPDKQKMNENRVMLASTSMNYQTMLAMSRANSVSNVTVITRQPQTPSPSLHNN